MTPEGQTEIGSEKVSSNKSQKTNSVKQEEELELDDEIPLGGLPQAGTVSPIFYQIAGAALLLCSAILALLRKRMRKSIG